MGRQVKEISPDSARIDLNGLLEDGEISEEERKKLMNLKHGVKLKKKTKKKLKHSKLGSNTETTESEKNGKVEEKAEDNGTLTTRNYRKKNEASDTDDKNKTESKKEKKIK